MYNSSIFRYYSSGEEKLTSKIKDLDAKIDEAISKETSLPLRDTKALEKQIENQIIELRKENNIQNISKTKKEISNNIVKKAKIAGEYSPAGSDLKKLIDERTKYENQLNEGAEYVKSPISGAVSYKVDGYEEVFTTDDFSKINAKFLPTNVLISLPAFLSAFNFAANSKKYLISSGVYWSIVLNDVCCKLFMITSYFKLLI